MYCNDSTARSLLLRSSTSSTAVSSQSSPSSSSSHDGDSFSRRYSHPVPPYQRRPDHGRIEERVPRRPQGRPQRRPDRDLRYRVVPQVHARICASGHDGEGRCDCDRGVEVAVDRRRPSTTTTRRRAPPTKERTDRAPTHAASATAATSPTTTPPPSSRAAGRRTRRRTRRSRSGCSACRTPDAARPRRRSSSSYLGGRGCPMMPLRTDVRVTADIAPAMSPTSSDAAVPDVPPFALSGASPFLHAPDTFFVRIRVIHSASQTVLFRSVEPTCAALGTDQIQPHTSKGGKAKEIPSCPCS